MGLQSIIAAATGIAFRAAGDVSKAATIYAEPSAVYDNVNDQNVVTWGATIEVPDAILYDAKEDARQSKGQSPEEKPTIERRVMLIKADGVTSAIDETCEVLAEGKRWKCDGVAIDPAGATYELQLYR